MQRAMSGARHGSAISGLAIPRVAIGAIRWETDEEVPLQDFAVTQAGNPYATTRLLLDGQQRLTSLSAVIRGEPVTVQGRKRPIDILFNLEHPERLAVVTEVNEDSEDEEFAGILRTWRTARTSLRRASTRWRSSWRRGSWRPSHG